ncbi:MAG TPA: hypothetical protein V6C88_16295 [Chroococcidiopsis sp.]
MENNNLSPTSDKLSAKLKTMAFQGVVGAVSLTAAAVIPLLVQRFLGSPTPSAPASIAPAAVQTEVQVPADGEPSVTTAAEERPRNKKRDKPGK